MNANDGSLNYELILNDSKFQAALKREAREVQGFSNQTVRQTSAVENSFRTLAVAAAGFFSIQAAQRFVSQLVHVRGEFQQLSIAMTTMLGSKQKADDLMSQLIQTAATTPFALTEVAQGAKQLLAYGTAATDVNDTLIRLGNIASGLSIPLGDLVYLYGTTQTQGRLFTQDVRQFMGRGIPLVQELAKQMGKTTDQVNDMVTAGKVGFPEVQKVIQSLTNEGGMFFDLMKKQSASLTGQISNLGDAFDVMLNEIGTSSQGIISSVIGGAATVVENYKTILGILAEIAAMYGTYRAAVIAYNLVQIQTNALTDLAIIKGTALTAMEKLKVFWIEAETVAQGALNKVLIANPYIAVSVAVAGLVTAYLLLRDTTTATEKATAELNKEMDERNQQIESQRQKTQDLINIIKSETSTRFAQVQAFRQLQQIYPDILKSVDLLTFKNSDATKSQKEFNAAIESNTLSILQKEYKGLLKSAQEYQDILNRNQANPNQGSGHTIQVYTNLLDKAKSKAQQLKNKIDQIKETNFEANASDADKLDYYNDQLAALEKQRGQLENNLSTTQKTGNALLDWKSTIESISLSGLNKQIGELLNKIAGFTPGTAKSNRQLIDSALSLGDLEETRKTINKAYQSATDAAQRKQLSADLKYADERKKALDVYAVAHASANKKSTTSDEQYATKKKSILDRINQLDQDNYRKSLTQNESEVQAVKDKYSEIIKTIEEYNKKAPKRHRIGSGTITSLQNSEQKVLGIVRYDQDTELLKSQIEKQKQVYQDYQSWKDNLGKEAADNQFADQKEGFDNYQDYVRSQIAVLMAQSLTLGGMTPAMQKRFKVFKQILNDAEAEARRSNDQILQDTLKSTETAQQKIEDIKRKYASKQKSLSDAGQLTPDRQAILDKDAQSEVNAVIQDVLSKEDDLRKAGDAIAGVTKSQIRAQIESLRTYLQSATSLTIAQRDQLQNVIQSLSVKMLTATDATTIGGREDILPGFDRLQDIETTIDNLKAKVSTTMADIGRLSSTVGAAANPQIKILMEQVGALNAQINDLNKQRLAALAEAFGSLADVVEGIGDDLSSVNVGLGQILKTIGSIGSSASGAFGGISKALDGINKIKDEHGLGAIFGAGKAGGGGLIGGLASVAGMIGPIGAGIGAAVKGITSIFSIGSKVKAQNKAARDSIAKWYAEAERGELEYQALLRKRALDNAKNNKNNYAGLISTMDEAKKQLPEVQKAYDALYKKLQGEEYVSGKGYKHGTLFRKAKTWDVMSSLYGSSYDDLEEKYSQGLLKDGAKKDFESLQKLRGELDDLGIDAEDAKQQLGEMLTGLNVDSFSDKIFDVIKQGAAAFDQLGTTIEDIIRTSVENGFKYRVVEKYLEPLLDDLQNHMIDGTADQTYLEQFKQKISDTGGVLNAMWAPIEDMLDAAFPGSKNGSTPQSGLTGQIKSITQDQANELAGLERLNVDTTKRMLSSLRDSNLIFNKQLSELGAIKVNTANTVTRLDTTNRKLDQVISNTKTQSTRDLNI